MCGELDVGVSVEGMRGVGCECGGGEMMGGVRPELIGWLGSKCGIDGGVGVNRTVDE